MQYNWYISTPSRAIKFAGGLIAQGLGIQDIARQIDIVSAVVQVDQAKHQERVVLAAFLVGPKVDDAVVFAQRETQFLSRRTLLPTRIKNERWLAMIALSR